MNSLLTLIVEFFKTGLFAVGGGLATLPFLYEMGEKTGWFTAQDVLNLLAVSESTPGPIGINMSTYVGFITAGIRVAVCALIASSVLKLAKSNVKKWWHVALAVVAFIWVVMGQSPVWMVVACAVLGIVMGRTVKKA